MNKRILSTILVLLLLVNPILSWMEARTVAAENTKTFTVTDQAFYNKLKNGIFSGNVSIVTADDENKTITLDTEAVTKLKMDLGNVKISNGNNKEILETLFDNCTNLKSLFLINCDLSSVDFSRIANKTDLSLLYLDACSITDIRFIQNMKNLEFLSFGDDKLTDDALSAFIDMHSGLSSLQELNLGMTVNQMNGQSGKSGSSSQNKFTATANLASLPEYFPNLKNLDLSGLKITSLQDFANISDDVRIDFTKNCITDFAGCESRSKWNFNAQSYPLFYNFAKGWGNEIPDMIKRVMDPDDPLYSPPFKNLSSFEYSLCSLSPDGNTIIISSDAPSTSSATMYVNRGKLSSTKFILMYNINIPDPLIPEGLTATEGDTLAKLDLNVPPQDGVFAWENPGQDVGTAGNHTFKATYTLEYEGHRYIKYGIDVPVIVKAVAGKPTPVPIVPTLSPAIPSPSPAATSPSSATPSPSPAATLPSSATPSPSPAAQTPTVPSPVPAAPKPTTAAPTQKPTKATEAPAVPIQKPAKLPTASTTRPDESKLTGNQIEKLKDLSILLAIGKQKGSNGIKLTWREKKDCDGYEVYGSYCDGKQNFKKLKTVGRNGKRVYVHRNLKKNRAYKYYIATYTIRNGNKNYQSKSPSIHVAMKREKHTNAKRIKVNKSKITIKEKRSFQIKAKAVLENRKKKLLNHERRFRYYVDNRDVASVSRKGKIKAKQKGNCTVFITTNNGVATQIKVTVN